MRRPGIGLGGAATTPDGLACPCGDVPRSAPAASSSENATPRPVRLSSAPPSAALAGRPRSSPSVSTPPPPAAQPAPPPPHGTAARSAGTGQAVGGARVGAGSRPSSGASPSRSQIGTGDGFVASHCDRARRAGARMCGAIGRQRWGVLKHAQIAHWTIGGNPCPASNWGFPLFRSDWD